MNQPDRKAQVNSAELILRLLDGISTLPGKTTIPRALAMVMPFRSSEDYPENEAILDSSLRIATVINTLRELSSIIEHAQVEKETARAALGNLLETFKVMPRQLDSNASWIQNTVLPTTVVSLKSLAYHLPRDRPEPNRTEIKELIVAIAALRALAADARTPAAVAGQLAKVVQVLEEMMLNAHFNGPNAVVDALGRWKRFHNGLMAAKDNMREEDAEVSRELDDAYRSVVDKLRAFADDALRTAGVLELANKGWAALASYLPN